MATIENLSSTLASLNGIVPAMQVENQQKSYDLSLMQAQVASMATAQDLQAIKDAQAALNLANDQKWEPAHPNFNTMEQKIIDMIARIDQVEIRGVGLSSSASGGKGWQLTRPKDMEPSEFTGKDEEWLRWKDAMEDYVDAVHPGLKHVLHLAAKANSQLDARVQLNSTEQEWNLSCSLFVLLNEKTAGEARSPA